MIATLLARRVVFRRPYLDHMEVGDRTVLDGWQDWQKVVPLPSGKARQAPQEQEAAESKHGGELATAQWTQAVHDIKKKYACGGTALTLWISP